MKITPRLSLGNFLNSEWVSYANSRTGVLLDRTHGNCFTYATARQSEILGKKQPLDEPNRVNGAEELITKHTSCYKKINYAKVGCLAVYGGGKVYEPSLGRYVEYGHVSVIEEVRNGGLDCTWSQSNYGGTVFEIVRGNPATYYASQGLSLLCFLCHEDLLKEEPKKYTVSYSAHVQDIGWQTEKHDGEVCGTVGKNKRLEAFKVYRNDGKNIEYVKAHIQDNGWITYENPNKDTVIGTVGKSKRIECLCIKAIGLKFRVHIQNVGWSSWTNCDGVSTLGSVGQSLRIEAIEIKKV